PRVTQVALPLAHPAHEVVKPSPVLPAAPHQVAQRIARVIAPEDPLTHLVERFPDVIRRRERVRPVVVGPIPVSVGHFLLRPPPPPATRCQRREPTSRSERSRC